MIPFPPFLGHVEGPILLLLLSDVVTGYIYGKGDPSWPNICA